MSYRAVVLSAIVFIAVVGIQLDASTASLDQPKTVLQPQQDAAEKRAAASSNVRIEIVLTNRAEGKTLTEERLTMILADRQLGRLRRHMPSFDLAFNRNFQVDVTPTVLGSRIQLALTVHYQTQRESGVDSPGQVPQTVEFVQTATSLVEPGKPMTIIDVTGDPANRRVTVQATATVQK